MSEPEAEPGSARDTSNKKVASPIPTGHAAAIDGEATMDGVSEKVRCPTGRQPGRAELKDAVDIDAIDPPVTAHD